MSIFEYLSKESVYESENSESIDQSLSFLEIEDLMSLNPNDANLLRGVERNSRLINHGNFSVDLSTVQIDYVHFNSYSHITYKAKVKNNGVPQNQYSLDCSTGKKYNWDLNEWVIPKSRDEKTLLNTICNDKENDPKIISLLDEYNWKKYSNNQWLNVNNWVEDKKTSYEDFDTEFYTSKDQEISKITVDCTNNRISFLKRNKWTSYEKPIGTLKNILNEKCGLVTSSSSFRSSSNLIEWERDNGQKVIFDSSSLKGYKENWHDGEPLGRKRLNYKYTVEDKDGGSREYRVFLWCRKYKAALEEDGTDMYDSSLGYRWLGLRKKDTYAKREAIKIIKEFCPKFKEIKKNTQTPLRY